MWGEGGSKKVRKKVKKEGMQWVEQGKKEGKHSGCGGGRKKKLVC